MRIGEWPTVELGGVLQLALDQHLVEPETTYPTIGVYGFGRGIITAKPPVLGRDTAATALYRVRAGQFIYSKLKAFEGAFAVVTAEGDGRFASNEFPTFDIRQDILLPDFLSWFFRMSNVWEAISADSAGIGARRERLHPAHLLRFRMPLPSLSEQRRIVERLDAVAARLANRQGTLQDQQRDLNALLHAAFARITTDAPRARMGDIAPLVRRPVDVRHDRMYPELGIRSFGRGTFHKPAVAGADVGSKRLFAIEPGDLLFSNVFAWEGAVAIASLDDVGRVGSHRFMTCVADHTRISAEMLRFFFLTPEGLKLLGDASPGGAGRNRTLGLAALERIEVPVPGKDAQVWFDRLHTKVTALRAQHAAITADCDALLPAMLNEIFG